MLVDVKKAIEDIRLDKSSNGDITADILKQCDLYFQALTNYINQSIGSGKFSDSLKLTNISPVYRAKDALDKTIYRPVSVLPLLSKIYKRLFFDQLSRHANKVLSKLLCDARKMLSSDYFSYGNRRLTTQNKLAQCSWICQKLMSVFLMIY